MSCPTTRSAPAHPSRTSLLSVPVFQPCLSGGRAHEECVDGRVAPHGLEGVYRLEDRLRTHARTGAHKHTHAHT
eukprot:5150362-Pleurochrysis_carterae.AAC.1